MLVAVAVSAAAVSGVDFPGGFGSGSLRGLYTGHMGRIVWCLFLGYCGARCSWVLAILHIQSGQVRGQACRVLGFVFILYQYGGF